MDTLFIPGWLITFVIVAILVLILLVKGYVNATFPIVICNSLG